jgi:hypothetical protein
LKGCSGLSLQRFNALTNVAAKLESAWQSDKSWPCKT